MIRTIASLLASALILAPPQAPRPFTAHITPPQWAANGYDPGLVAAGRTIAMRHCASCHAVDPGQASPLPDAPPFPILYERFPVEQLNMALDDGLMVGHPRMPNPNLDATEATALVAYLSHFRPAREQRRLGDGAG